jgi:hypothetical protein
MGVLRTPMDTLIKDQLEFRQLLSEHGLIKLAGGHEDAISWLESQVTELVNLISRRRRFIGLLREAREILYRGREESRVLLNGERIERPNPYVEARFRRIKI